MARLRSTKLSYYWIKVTGAESSLPVPSARAACPTKLLTQNLQLPSENQNCRHKTERVRFELTVQLALHASFQD